MKSEPVITVASLTAFVAAVLAVLAAFGLPLTDDQQKAILGLVAVVAPVVVGVLARRFVTPVTGGARRGLPPGSPTDKPAA